MPSFPIVNTQRIYEGKIIKVRVDNVLTSEGKAVRREVVEHPGAIVVAAIDDKGRVLLVRQWRHAAKQALLELPAGTLEPGEEPRLAALREMQEETGFYPQELIPVGGFFSAPGFCEEYLHFFIARGLRAQKLRGDDDEDISVEATALSAIPGLVLSGHIKDAKTLAGLYILQAWEKR